MPELDVQRHIVVLGATGHFGKRISHRLIDEPHSSLTVTSRSLDRAQALAQELSVESKTDGIQAAALNQQSEDFESRLAALKPDIVIHTAGPYQGQDYRVAQACIDCGSHYVDLADGRAFVAEFGSLNEQALGQDVLLVTGASTLPGLSSVVLSEVGGSLNQIKTVEISIAPAHQTPRGIGTIEAVLSYCGRRFDVLIDKVWQQRYGWQDLKTYRYPDLGRRLAAACDVPDLGLIPARLDDVETVTFHAALESKFEQLTLWLMAALVRLGLVRNWSQHAPRFQRIGKRLISLGSDRGGMHLTLNGQDGDGNLRAITWHLTAEQNHGPEIPCTPALIIARKLVSGQITARGAIPCWNLFTLEEFDHEVSNFDIRWKIKDSIDR